MFFRVSLFSINKLTTTTFHKKFMRINNSRRETFGMFLNAFEVIYFLGQGLQKRACFGVSFVSCK